MCFKGALFGHISNGGGTIDLGNGKSIKFIANSEKFITLQLLESGIGIEVKTQSWNKTKVEKQTVIKTIYKKPTVKKSITEFVDKVDEEYIL